MRVHTTPIAASSAVLESYEPDLPETDWWKVRDFVLEVSAEVAPLVPYPTAAVVNAVAHHVDWCVNVAGFAMERGRVFRRDVIGAAVAVMPTTQSSSRGRRRSLLFRVGEALGVIPVAMPLPPLAAADPMAPYSPQEIQEVTRWAWTQQGRRLASARALVALGLGAGLHRRDLMTVRASDVLSDGEYVSVAGDNPRVVPISDAWTDDLKELAVAAEDGTLPLFCPTVERSKNMITVFVYRSLGSGLRPSTQRMRATWLVQQMATGLPVQDLLASSGVSSLNSLVRYERFLPPPSQAAHAGTQR